jgi:two-component system sensor histidine kinase HydH
MDTTRSLEQTALYREARRVANRKIGFYGHMVVFACTGLFLFVVAGPFVTAVVLLSWGIFLAAHGFFFVAAPILRGRWLADVERRTQTTVVYERRELEGRHARSIEQLSASIAHEIRNPITAARSLVAQMGEDPSRPENVEYARVALEELDRVERSISHLLRFARDEEIDVREVSLVEIVDSALETFRERIARGGVEVVRDLSEVAAMRADPEKLRRVVINLVGNALDAVDGAGVPAPRVEVAAGVNLARTEVWLRVRDNGPGIPKEALERIFSPFHTTKPTGTGLGLAISKKIAEAHGGTLEARSEGEGAELLMVIPKSGGAAA